MERALYDQLADVEDHHWWWRARREIIADVISQYAPAPPAGGLKLAEVGCGSGGNLPMMTRFGEVLGAEPDEGAIEYLHQKLGGAFHVIRHAVPEPLPSRYHVVAMLDVLEHIQDDAGTLRWAAEQLEPGGILILTVPAFQFLWTEHDEAAHHFRRYSPRQLEQLLPPMLSLEHLSCFNSVLFLPILAIKAMMRMRRRDGRAPHAHLGIPPEPFNWIFYQLFRQERRVVVRGRFSFGVSVLLVARRRSPPA